MSLSDEVTSRIPDQTLVELTRAKDKSATTVDSTKLTAACTAVSGTYFKMYAQKTYDSTDPMHVEVAVEGVVAVLMRWGAAVFSNAQERWAAWVEEAKRLADVTVRSRIRPQSTSTLTRSTEKTGALPDMDRNRFASIVPDNDPGEVTPGDT